MKYIFAALFLATNVFASNAQFVLYGYDSKSLKPATTSIFLNEKDSVYKAGLERVKSDWILTSSVSMINADKPNSMKVLEGNTAIVPLIENLPTGEINYRLSFVVASKDFGVIGNNVNGFYTRITGGEIIASLVINADQLHTIHCSNLIMGVATLARATSFFKTDADKENKWKKSYHFEGIKDVVFEPADLDVLVNDKYKVEQVMNHGLVMTDEMRNSPDLFVKMTRGFAYITTEYRSGQEPLIHRFYIVPGKALVYLRTDTQTDHPVHKFTRDDLFLYGKALREGH